MITLERGLIKRLRPFFYLYLIFIGLLVLAGCGGSAATETPIPEPVTTETPGRSEATGEIPATNDIATAELPLETPEPQLTDDDFLAIDEILGDIDNDVCQTAYETKLELELLIAEGVDVAELEAAVEELIEELENCSTPTPTPQP